MVGRLLNHGITEEQLIVRKFVQCRRGVKELLYEVDLAIMPSKSEGFGLVALEALSAGLPVLVGSNSGFASAIRDLPLGACSIVDSDDPAKWAEAIEGVCSRHRVCLEENKILRERYRKEYVWKTQCKALVKRLWGMISDDQETSKVPHQAVAAGNLGEQGPSSVSEAVSHPDATTIEQHIVGDVVSSGRENVIQRERPRTYPLTTTEGRQQLNAGIPEKNPGKRPLHPSETTTLERKRQNTDILEKSPGKDPLHPSETATPERKRENTDIRENPLASLSSQESSFKGQSLISALKVTLLSSEWRSSKGRLSTINRELAIHLAKHSNVEVSMYVPQCREEDKRAAAARSVCIIEAEEVPGYDPIDWLATIPRDHQMDFVIGHGIHLGRQVPPIKRVHRECKWIQVVHTDPEELGMFKDYGDSIAKGKEKHQAEVELCKLADHVVAIGPKLAEAFSRYLQSCGKDQDVLNLTPGIFSEFADITQAAEDRGRFHVLVFGRGDSEDFYLKGYDIAAHAVAELCKHEPHLFKLVFVGAPKQKEEKVKEMLLKEGVAPRQLIVRSYEERGQLAAQFFEADLAIMPSRSEGFGLAALEALSAGLPVLVSGNSGLGDALKELPFGSSCVVNSEDANEWAKAIRTIHDKKRKLRLREAVKVRESYAEEYHWEGECGRLVERMLNIIQVSPGRRSVEKQRKRPSHVHLSASPPGEKQRRDTYTLRASGIKEGQGDKKAIDEEGKQYVGNEGKDDRRGDEGDKTETQGREHCEQDTCDDDQSEQISETTEEDLFHGIHKQQMEEREEPNKVAIFEGAVTSEGMHLDLQAGTIHLTFPPNTVAEPTRLLVYRWKCGACLPYRAEHEAVVSDVIEICAPPEDGSLKFKSEVDLIISHSATDLEGYELVIKGLIDTEKNEWEEIPGCKDIRQVSVIEDDYPCPNNVPYSLPVVRAGITKCSTYALVSRLKLSPTYTITVSGGTFVHPDYPQVTITVPEKAVATETRLSLQLKVQEVPHDEFKDHDLFVGPILRVLCSSGSTFLEPVTIQLPVSLRDNLANIPHPCRVRVFFLNSERKTREWDEVSDKLENPASYNGNLVKFKVRGFSMYTYILDWTKDGFRAASRVIRYLSSIVWNQPLVANFFAYFKPKESLDFRDILFLICCPAHLEDKIKQEYESKKITLCDASSKGKMIPEYDKAFVDVSGGISPACSEDMDDFYLSLHNDTPHKAHLEVRLISNQEYCKVEFRNEDGILLSTLKWKLSSPSINRQDCNFPRTSSATSQETQESSFTGQSPISALKVTLLSSEWRSTKGGLSTINRELAIHLAKHSNVEVSMYLPQCSEEDKRAAAAHNVRVIEAEEIPGYDPIDWLATIPRDHQMDFVIGHGIHLGRQVPLIKRVHRECKWIQVVHTDPEELGMFKNYADSIAKGEEKHRAEVKLCKLADQVVAIGPKLVEAFSCYLRSCGKDQDVLNLTPGIFSEFADVTQAAEEGGRFRVLVFGRGDSEDFYLKGYDIAARAVAELCKHEQHLFKLVFVGAPKGEEEKVKEMLLKEGIAARQLIVRSYKEREELAAQFCEADLAIMPSRSEGFGLAALEALSAGLPVLVSGNSGIGDALKELPFGWSCIVNSEDANEWAKAIRTIYDKKRKSRLREAVNVRESYAEEYEWEGECGRLVERMLNIIQGNQERANEQLGKIEGNQERVHEQLGKIEETSMAPDQAVAADNLGEQGPSSISEAVSHPDVTTIQQHIVGDVVSSGRENVIQGERPRTHPLTTTEGRQQLTAGIPEISSKGRSIEKQGRRPLQLHPSATPPVKKQRRDTDICRVFPHYPVVVKLLRAEYNRRAQLRPLFWDNTMQLPLEKVYTRLKIVSRQRGGNQGDTNSWNWKFPEDFRRDEIWAEAQANKTNPCVIFGMLKEKKDVMTIVEGSPGIGKTTFCLKLAYEWANQGSSAASFPEFELVLLLKCRDINGDLTEAITEQLFPKDMSKDAREELLHFLEDIENQERVLIILDGLDEFAEKSKHYVDDLLHRKRWACCYVLATTRQEKGIEVRKQFVFNLFLQIEGFTEEKSFEYIRRHFKIAGPEHSSKGEKLIKEIKKNAILQDLQTNPLNLLLLCVVYEDHEGELPSSRSDLYHEIVVCLLRRYCAKHDVKASEKDKDLETQFERDICCLGKLGWNCLLDDRHSFFEEELKEMESRNEKLVTRELGFVYKEESLKRLKPKHEYCFLHKSFQEYLAASYIAHKLRRNKFNVFEHLGFDAVVNKFPQVFVFVCGILHEEASILFAQIGEKLKSDWDWLECSEAEANFFIKSWSESGNAERMANTLCSFIPFPRVVRLSFNDDSDPNWGLHSVLLFCRRFSKVEAPDEIHFAAYWLSLSLDLASIEDRDLTSLPNLKSLDFFDCYMDVELAHELFERLPNFASLTALGLPDVPEMTDWGIVAKALTTSKTLETVGCILLGERGEGWARALDAGLRADTPLSSVSLTICGPMSESALQILENLLLNKSLSSVSITVEGDMSYSLAVALSRALAVQTAVKSLELRVNGKLSFCCANLIERGIVENNSITNLVVSLHRELPDNWQAIVENLNVRLAEKSTVIFEVYPNTFSQFTTTPLTDFRPFESSFFERKSVTLNVWGELTVDGSRALYNVLPCTRVCHLTLNIHGKLTDDFLHCTARHVDIQESLCPITINTWDQLTNEGKTLFKELELDKNPAVTLNVCDVPVPSDESGNNKFVFIDNPASLIALLEEAENTGKENLRVTINVQSDDSTYTGSSWNDSLHLGLERCCSLNSLTLTINNFSPRSTGLSLTLIGCLEGCISLKSLTLTLNEYNEWEDTYVTLLHEGLARNTSLISLTLTLNVYTGILDYSYFRFRDDSFVPNTSINSFTLTINDFSISGCWGLDSVVPWPNYKSLTTLNLTLNRYNEVHVDLPDFLRVVRKVNSLRTLRLKIDHWELTPWNGYLEDYFSEWVLESPSLELIELTITCFEVKWSSIETLKWEKQS